MWEKAIGERSPEPKARQLLAASHTDDYLYSFTSSID